MLFIVLLLVLGALGLLVAALTTANTLWAWISVAVSLVAAGILVVDWIGNRRRAPAEAGATEVAEPVGIANTAGSSESSVVLPPVDEYRADDYVEARPPVPVEVPTAPAHAEAEAPIGVDDPDREPPEEATDAADLLVISDLRVDVRVLDERPRYHLPRCAWVGGRPTITLPVAEARQLGFTPCAFCGPDAVLAARHREGRGARQPRPETT
ncbi:hypothetical protein [Actinokineospora sp. NBRC 105648]|uniref:hypothetical protein n=1 Tax=Actinokineospora sp. NBRC 105648 TaxID=3032206 RepID=UPI0024A5D645|nr:hypothetical protein [Actinokineospora sp. NBRC 105648]GLZ42157.1 hypothetical protein Acsp05_57810 [Actinokineospora sp. NBRC 105648]